MIWHKKWATKTFTNKWRVGACVNTNYQYDLHITRQSLRTRWPLGPWRYGARYHGGCATTSIATRPERVIRMSGSVRGSIRWFARDAFRHIAGDRIAVVVVDVKVGLVGAQVLLQQLFGHPDRHVAGDEGMGKQALGSRSLFGILGEGCLDERVECRWPFVLFFERRWFEATFRHEEQRSHWV